MIIFKTLNKSIILFNSIWNSSRAMSQKLKSANLKNKQKMKFPNKMKKKSKINLIQKLTKVNIIIKKNLLILI